MDYLIICQAFTHMLEYGDLQFFRLQYQTLLKAICDQTEADSIETRPVCVVDGEGCLRAYAIVQVTAEGTTTLRIEGADGIVIEDAVLTNCTCDCVDVQA